MKIVLRGKPRSTNNIYRYTRTGKFVSGYMTKEGKQLKASYIKQIKDQYSGPPLSGPLHIEIHIYRFGREPDRDNVHKLSIDAGNKLLWKDDIQIKKAIVIKEKKDNKDPRMIFYIKQLQ